MAETEIEGSSLTAIVADELRQAQTFDQTKRTLALQYMRGEMPDLPARVNGSSQTARVLADVQRGIGLGPEHDWSSHGADAFGLMCVHYTEPTSTDMPQVENDWVA